MTPDNIDNNKNSNLKDKTVAIVTGGNSGLGYETALAFMKRGTKTEQQQPPHLKKAMHVIITGRSKERLEQAVESIRKELGANTTDSGHSNEDNTIEWIICDQASLSSIENFVRTFKKRNLPLHILVNNAGGFFYEPFFTHDGLEQHLAVNHLAHFYLTLLLLDTMKETASAAATSNEKGNVRIVTVSSYLHLTATGTDWDTLGFRENPGLPGYAASKLANILFVRALGKRLKESNLFVYIVHPGYSKTNGLTKPKGLLGYITPITSRLVTTSAATGATAQIQAAIDPSYSNRGDLSTTMIGPAIPLPFFPQTTEWNLVHPLFVNDTEAEKLWNWSCRILQEKRGFKSVI